MIGSVGVRAAFLHAHLHCLSSSDKQGCLSEPSAAWRHTLMSKYERYPFMLGLVDASSSLASRITVEASNILQIASSCVLRGY